MARYTILPSPVGPLVIECDDNGNITRNSFLGEARIEDLTRPLEEAGAIREDPEHAELLAPVIAELKAYFAKTLTRFTVPMKPEGTPFQRQVWDQLREIPYGRCITYGDIAHAIGKPGASRAVGLANNKNPISIIIPCHRCIGASGTLTGFGGGTDVKHTLLVHEGYFLL